MMSFIRFLALAGLGCLAASAHAEPSWRDFKDVVNTSYTEPSGERSLQLSIDVAARPHEVFEAFTTSKGFSSWAVPLAKVDFRIGGTIEASYEPSAKLGDPGNIKNAIVAYVPDRVLVIHNIQAPADFADQDLFRHTVTVIEFTGLGHGRTRVTITNAGYGAGERFDTLYRHFEWGNAYTLQALKTRFEKGPVDWSAERSQGASETADREVKKTD
jgi:uncharacterized protein YndB with AHSA1/START domain